MMRSILLLPCLFVMGLLGSTEARADLIIKQKVTSDDGQTQHVTQFLSEGRYRIDTVSDKTKSVVIFNGKAMISCQKTLPSSEKGTCARIEFKKLRATMQGMSGGIRVLQHGVRPTGKSGKMLGRACRYFKRNMTVETDMGGMGSLAKTTDVFCVDTSVTIPGKLMAMQLLGNLSAMISKKQMRKIVAKEKKAAGLILYQKSVTKMQTKMDAVEGIMDVVGTTLPANQTMTRVIKTISVKETAISPQVFRVPVKEFKPPAAAQ